MLYRDIFITPITGNHMENKWQMEWNLGLNSVYSGL